MPAVTEVGRGGMGVVYKAEYTKLKRFVALKFLRSDVLEDEEHKARFLREAQAAAALDHPNICTIYEIDEVDGQTFIAMAYIEGQTLTDRIEVGSLKIDDVLDIGLQAAAGLAAAHEKEIVHRDIKSANIMVTPQGQVKIMDFGLAQLSGPLPLTKPGTTLGTPAYMSPEQVTGKDVDRRSDIWSLGVVLYNIVTGQMPFRGEYEQAVMYSIVNEDPEPITALRVAVPTELDRIIGKALAKDPRDRYPHVEDVLVDLRALKRQFESDSAQTLPSVAAVLHSSRTGWYAAAAVVLFALIAVAWFTVFGPTGKAPPAALSVVPLSSYPGTEQHASCSPDGNQIAFSWNGETQENYDIYVKLVGSATRLQLTTDPAPDRRPAWSPDGTQLAFLRERAGGIAEVLLVPAISGPKRKLAEIQAAPPRDVGAAAFSASLAWSSDRRFLAITVRTAPPRSLRAFSYFQSTTVQSGG